MVPVVVERGGVCGVKQIDTVVSRSRPALQDDGVSFPAHGRVVKTEHLLAIILAVVILEWRRE